ncbi:MAG: type II and III secretion system protein [Armatimonadota bacterium]|nr:type II and III secretion system protein [Armatimonadota bacterium]
MGFRQRQRFPLKPGLTTALCGLMAVGGLPALIGHDGAIFAQAQAGGMDASAGRPVDISIVNGDLAMVIKLLQQQTGMEVLLQDAGRPFGKVSVTLTHASPMKALRTIAASANATISKNEDGVYVLRAGGGGNDAADVAPMQAALPADPTPAPLANTSLRKIVLQHAKPSDVMKIMHWDQYYTEINPYGKNNLDTIRPDIITMGGNYMLNANPVNNGYNNSNDSAPSVPIGQGNQGGVAANRSANEANRTADPSDQAQQFPGGGFGGQGGRGGFGRGGGGFGGQQGGFGGQQGGNQQQLPEGVDRIYALEGDNSLLVEATTDGYEKIKKIIQYLDIAPRQVQIKVEFVTASITDVDSFGINFSLIPHPGVQVSNNQGGQALFSGVPYTNVTYTAGNLVSEFFNSLVRTRGKVVQAPLITTTNNVPATIQIQTLIPFVTTTNVVGGSGNVVSNSQQNFLPINTNLTVSPRINADDTVTLQLQPQISDVAGAPAIAGGPPPTTTQALQTLRTVRSGDTMVLGGFVRKADSRTQSRIPILADLPFIGNLFRNRVINEQDQELLIFVTPTIIDEGGEGLATSAGPNVSVAP